MYACLYDSACMCMYGHVCIRTRFCVYVYKDMFACACMYIHVYVHINKSTYVYRSVYACVGVYFLHGEPPRNEAPENGLKLSLVDGMGRSEVRKTSSAAGSSCDREEDLIAEKGYSPNSSCEAL